MASETEPLKSPHFKKGVRFVPDALALVYDLESFSKFANQPDGARFVPELLNEVAAAVTLLIQGGKAPWDAILWAPIPGLLQRKFMGDGELLVFENSPDTTEIQIISFLNRFYNLQLRYEDGIIPNIREKVPLPFLPARIRIGVARGSLLEITNASTAEREYIGICVNLASRLQNYCKELTFIASARVVLSSQSLDTYKYTRVTAKNIPGFGPEEVLVSTVPFRGLSAKSSKLFSAQARKQAKRS